MGALASLACLPQRCPPAPEDRELPGAPGIHHLILGDYRVLFRITTWGVLVLHVRHGSRRPATRAELGLAPGSTIPPSGPITGD